MAEKKKKRKKDDNGEKMCSCGLLAKHRGPCGKFDDKRNADAIPYFAPEEEKPKQTEV